MKKIGGLGKGLDALIPTSYLDLVEEERKENKGSKEEQGKATKERKLPEGRAEAHEKSRFGDLEPQKSAALESAGLAVIDVGEINANPDQPREAFEEGRIEELAASIREQGLLHPIVVKKALGSGYEMVCGERRLLAARKLGWQKIPAIIKDVASNRLLELALVENIQREDLNAIEEAQAFKKLVVDRALSPEEVGVRVGRDRTTVTNTLRLLRLPEEVQVLIKSEKISAGHARALLGLPSPEHQRRLADRIVAEQLSVRQVEEIVQRTGLGKRRAKMLRHLDSEIVDLEHRLSERLGTKVRIFANKGNKGRLEIRYNSLDDLDRILDVVGVRKI